MDAWWVTEAEGSDPLFQEGLHLSLLRKAIQSLLREHQVLVEPHLEDPAGAADQLRVEPETILNRGRQTGGPGLVVSSPAVLDRQSVAIGHDPSLRRFDIRRLSRRL